MKFYVSVIANQSADLCGNPYAFALENGFPRRCAHRLGMTFFVFCFTLEDFCGMINYYENSEESHGNPSCQPF